MMDRTFSYLKKLASNLGVTIRYSYKMNNTTPSVYDPYSNQIVLNMNATDMLFQFAHEIAHSLTRESCLLYKTSNIFHSKAEYEANSLAIKILKDFYFKDVEIENRRIDNFMLYYKIPYNFWDLCMTA